MFALRKTGLLEKRAAADASAIADANDTDYQKKLQELSKETASIITKLSYDKEKNFDSIRILAKKLVDRKH